MFENLHIEGWRQFHRVDLSFHPHLTILTGANGTGKTTILNILSRHFGWSMYLASTPGKRRKGILSFFPDIWRRVTDQRGAGWIGEIRYRDAPPSALRVPEQVEAQFLISIDSQASVAGLYIPSHRPAYFHQPVTHIPTRVEPREQLFQAYLSTIISRYSPNTYVQSPSFRIKEALISLAVFGYGSEALDPDQEAIETFEGFQQILQQVLPPSLGFNQLRIELPEVVLETSSGRFSLDAVSGGVAALIDLAWQIYLQSLINERFCVVIDEPENHLHPELQRTVFPNLVNAFPQCQFVAATHNPFVVGSMADSNVYVFDYNAESRVESQLLDLANKAGTANEILREVLGVETTLPLWVEQELRQIVSAYSEQPLTEERLRALRTEMRGLGLEDWFPETLTRLPSEGE